MRANQESSNKLMPARLRSGPEIFVYDSDYVSQMVLLFGDLDPTVSAFILKNISDGDAIVDVGANLGVISLQAAKKVGPSGKVFAIEPSAICSKALSLSKSKNKFQNLKIIECALSNFVGKANIIVPVKSYGQSRLSAEAVDMSHECQVSMLDVIEKDLNLKRIRVLKIDVEGHEYEVLLGGECLLRSGRVDIIVFESHQRECSFGSRREVSLLAAHGYTIYEIRKGSMLSLTLAKTGESYIPSGSEFAAIRNKMSVDVKTGFVIEGTDE